MNQDVTGAGRILLVEDERILAMDLQLTLEELGFTVLGIEDTAEGAVEACARCLPDVVLMDIRIRGEADGVDAARTIRERMDTPVIFLTAHDDRDTLRRAMLTDPYGYLVKPVRRGTLFTAVDIARRRKLLERNLEQERRWAETTLEAVGEGVIRLDLQGRITFVNPAACELLRLSGEELKGRNLRDVLRLERPELPVEKVLDMVLQEGRRVRGEPATMPVGEKPIVVADTTTPVLERGSPSGAVLVLRDLTQQSLLERKVALLDRLSSLGTLAAGVAHELNNPLTVLVSELELLRADLAHPGVRSALSRDTCAHLDESLGHIEQAVQQIAHVGRDLSRFTKPQELEERCELDRALAWARRLSHRTVIPVANLHTELPPGLRLPISELSLAQVLTNLFVNAAHAMAGRSMVQNHIWIRGQVLGDTLRVTVADSGPGVPEHLRDSIFEPFVTNKGAELGTGLGLPISRSLIERAGGTISLAAPQPDRPGACFVVTLPLLGA